MSFIFPRGTAYLREAPQRVGRHELALVASLGAVGLPVVVVNPRQVRDFARATGKLAKTHASDAQVLAFFAERVQPVPRPLPDADALVLSGLMARGRQLVAMLVAERNRLDTALPPVRPGIQEHIVWLEEQLRELNGELNHALRERPLWRGGRQPGSKTVQACQNL